MSIGCAAARSASDSIGIEPGFRYSPFRRRMSSAGSRSIRRIHCATTASSSVSMRLMRPFAATLGASATSSAYASSIGSTLRTVTGKAGCALTSRMPKRDGSLTSGGSSSMRTCIGKAAALASVRPASSFRSLGRTTVTSLRSANGPLNSTASTVATLGSIDARCTRPSVPRNSIFDAVSRAIGAVNSSCAGNTGMQPAFALTRWHVKRAENCGRT